MNTTTKTSPQGVAIEYIEGPTAAPRFSTVSAAGLTVEVLTPADLTDSERRAFGFDGGVA